jgi:hypothetical protein
MHLILIKIIDPGAAYNQLVAVSSWIQDYLQEAEDAYNVAKAYPASGQLEYYQKFHNIINDPNWEWYSGPESHYRPEGVSAAVKRIDQWDQLKYCTHHFGIEVNRVDASGIITMDPVSSLFGLINYVDPAYAQQIAQGLNPNKPYNHSRSYIRF